MGVNLYLEEPPEILPAGAREAELAPEFSGTRTGFLYGGNLE